MAKEIPYFKFYPAEHMTGAITLCSMSAQGVFNSICGFYWMRDCIMSLEDVKERFFDYEKEIEELIDKRKIIKIREKNGVNMIQINFLDIQYSKFSVISDRRAEAGSKGGRVERKMKRTKTKAKQMLDNNNILLNKNKNNNKIYITGDLLSNCLNIDYPFNSPKFRRTWRKWIRYKREEFNFKYKSSATQQTALNHLQTISNNDVENAIEIINRSMSNGWKGLFELRNNYNSLSKPQNTIGYVDTKKKYTKKEYEE